MDTKLTLKPGKRGTKKLVRKYGDRLICVRYRYDDKKKMRYKTVELIIDARPWTNRQKSEINSEAMVDV